MEPCLLDEVGPVILDLVAGLSAAASRLGDRLHPAAAASLADTVRIMNCYYSNLIEGHSTTPREIEAALRDQLEVTQDRRNLQLEARAHIRLQAEIDRRHAAQILPEPASADFIRWLHREFYAEATPVMLLVRGERRELRMQPGVFRSRPDEEVTVGRHQPPSADRVEAFMAHFAQRYGAVRGQGTRIAAMAAAHHRLNYIHPFLDGNGRVSRLISHAMALQAGIGANGLWSVSRGLARGLESRGEYRRMMDHADMPRQGDLDGRGNLSRRALAEFTVWFLKVCLDQVTFMASLFALDTLAVRLETYVERHRDWRPEAGRLLAQVMRQGEVRRGDAAPITGLRERSGRELLAQLVADGILGSETPKGPVSLRFPLHATEVLFPALFPQS